jgi:hypothetical protein
MAKTNIFLGQRCQRDDGAEFREADSPRRFDEILHDLFERNSPVWMNLRSSENLSLHRFLS